jgi:hypothetical protein
MGKTVAVLQSNYIPWKGYFDIIHEVDLFVFYDDVQFTKNDWRNRNLIKTPKGTEWLTIPVGSRLDRLISEVRIEDSYWAAKHWRSIVQYYAKAPYFQQYKAFFEDIYVQRSWHNLSELNQSLIKTIAREFLGIQAEFADSRSFRPQGQKLDRLLDLVGQLGATRYVSGPAARDYIDVNRFEEIGVEVLWKEYAGYPEYPQFFPPFTHQVTILDLLFQVGPESPEYIWGWREQSQTDTGSEHTIVG